MTKIKNTKKGMAKKTLSMSLVVAMLATSNVPVWAAEFSDGTDAAFTSEAEAPVVEEEVTDTPAAQAEDSQYNVEFKDLPSEIQWGKTATVKIKVTDAADNTNVTKSLNVRYLLNGVQDDNYGNGIPLSNNSYTVDSDGYVSFPILFAKTDAGKKYQLQLFEGTANAMTWSATSAEFTVAKKEITGTVTFNVDADTATRYTGSQVTAVPSKYSVTLNGAEANDTVDLENWKITGDDTVNSWNVSNKYVKASADIVSPYYTGTVTSADFQIWRKSVKNADEAATADLSNYTFEYTGADISVPAKDITVTDKTTKQIVENASKDLTIDGTVGKKSNVKVNVDMTKGSLKNIALNDNDFGANDQKVTLSKDIEVKARDLSNTTNTDASINTVTEDLLQNSTIDANALKNSNLVIKAAGSETNLMSNATFASNVSLEFENGATQLKVEPGKTYTAIVKGSGSNVINTRTVTFTVVAHDLNTATFTKENDYAHPATNPQYTGKQITFGLNASNLSEKLGQLKNGNTVLSAGTDYDVNVEFGENINAGKGQIIINGKGSYAGSKKIIEFTIDKRTVADKDVVVPKKVVYDSTITNVADYKVDASIVVKFKDGKEESSVTVPAEDYKVEYTGTNGVGNKITTTLTKTNAKSNFDFTSVKGTTTIANKAIKDADVQLNKTEYTYTGKAIIPDYTVTVDGVTLVKGTDYTETVTYNTEVGEATLTVTGKNEYDTTSVVKKFNIVAANINDLTVESAKDASGNNKIVYDGKQHVGNADTSTASATTSKLSIKLGDNVIDASQFIVTYPTSKTANINAGTGTVTLKPARNNKNFTGEKEFTFTIDQATLANGTLAAYDKNGTKIDLSSANFDYDGTAHEFAKLVYTNSSITKPMTLTTDDYEIVYKDNVKGDANSKGHVLVIAKGNYKAANTYKTADKEEIKNVALNTAFTINKVDLTQHSDITVANGTYKSGFDVDPVVTVSYKGKTLTEGVDYKLDYTGITQDRKNVTNGKTLKVKITGMGGYTGTTAVKAWGIDKFDFANATILVSGTDADPVIKVMNGSILVDAKEYDLTVADGKATVTATKDNKNYTGTQTVDIKHELEKPAAPMISNVNVVGNKATVILSGEVEGASGYDYVISTDRDCITNKNYTSVNKNQVKTSSAFEYVGQGTYYAYCHAWTRDENGKKVFGEWSNAYPFSVSAITPSQPVITSVKVSGSTVTVTYTKSSNADGYDVVLGTSTKKVNGETRPVEYGTLVKKNVKGNVVTATFKNVKKGTYYAGLHAFNRTSEDGKKVFSQWSNVKKVTVK